MPSIATQAEPVGKKKPSDAKTGDKQINFRANPALSARLDATADAFGMDVSALVRFILNQNLPRYEAQAQRIRDGLPPDDPAMSDAK